MSMDAELQERAKNEVCVLCGLLRCNANPHMVATGGQLGQHGSLSICHRCLALMVCTVAEALGETPAAWLERWEANSAIDALIESEP